MQPLRRLFLWAQQNEWLRRRVPESRAVQKAASRFMPGEELEDALRAARELGEDGISSVLTELGENVDTLEKAREERDRYLRVLERGAEGEEDVEISVKLTHLGLDQDPPRAREHVARLAERAAGTGGMVWVDMEASEYVEPTLELYHDLLPDHPNLGVCLQAYLYRTAEDLERILEEGGSVRMVKGAYDEPEEIAFPDKDDVDDAYLRLSERMLDSGGETGRRHAFGTHDLELVGRIRRAAVEREMPLVERENFEVQMLYGIRAAAQRRLAGEGVPVRTLISYGTQWYPWYMRRLAERPANVWFVVRSVFAG